MVEYHSICPQSQRQKISPCCPWSSHVSDLNAATQGTRSTLPSFFVGCLTSLQHASVSQGWICSNNFMCCHTDTEVADQTYISPSHSILTLGRPVPVLTLQRQVPGRVATGAPILKSLVWLDPEKSWHKRDFNPRSSVLEVDALTTRTMRQSLPSTWCSKLSTRTGWPGVRTLWLNEIVWSTTSALVWQHAPWSEQVCPWC